MSLRFVSLGSGSRGNALLVETRQVRLLVDCGFPAREIESRLQRLDVDPRTLQAILVTHEHGDHIRGVGAMARRYKLPVRMTAGTLRAADPGRLPQLDSIDCHAGWFGLGDLEVLPFPVPHDAREPCQFLLRNQKQCLGLLTDTGHVTPHILQRLEACDALVLEFNHDPEMLLRGPYPPSLQARVGGLQGHLSNHQAVDLLQRLPTERLRYLLASHLSEKNNSRECVKRAIANGEPGLLDRLHFASQDAHSDWFSLD